LKQTVDFTPPIKWTIVTNQITMSEGQNRVTVNAEGAHAFYRLTLE
jgi:hypothetical protein